MDTAGLEVGDDFEEFAQGASESVEAGDAQAIAGAGVVEEIGEPWSIGASSEGDIGENTNGAGLEQAIALGVGALLPGGHASVAQGVAGTRRCGGINVGRYSDGLWTHSVSPVVRD